VAMRYAKCDVFCYIQTDKF